MSYSFYVKGATKQETKEKLAATFDEQILRHQPDHARDRSAILAAANSFIDMIDEPGEKRQVMVRLHGFVGVRDAFERGGDRPVMTVNFSVDAYISG